MAAMFSKAYAVPRSQHSDVSFKGVNDSIIEQNIRVFFLFCLFGVCVSLQSQEKVDIALSTFTFPCVFAVVVLMFYQK